jgi:hypothetical protein
MPAMTEHIGFIGKLDLNLQSKSRSNSNGCNESLVLGKFNELILLINIVCRKFLNPAFVLRKGPKPSFNSDEENLKVSSITRFPMHGTDLSQIHFFD